MKEQAYSFDYGDVHFVMLDTQAGEQKQFLPDLLARQKVWLEKDLAQTKKRWTIVFMHRPPYDNKTFHDNTAIRKAFTPIFDAHQVDLVFTGHDHVYARTYPLRNGAVSPGGGTVYAATGRSGSKFYSTVAANPLNAFFYNPQDEPNYLTVMVKTNSISVQAFKQSGTLIDAWAVRK
jgi:3',5'-cyclic AMP phosphodiesterase CpdA